MIHTRFANFFMFSSFHVFVINKAFFLAAFCLAIHFNSFIYAADNWVDLREAGPFVVRANFSLERFGPLVMHLNGLQNDLVAQLGVPPAKEKIELLLFRDEWTYRDYLRRNLPHISYRRALFVKQQGPGIVLVHWSKDFEVDIRHECTHALLHAGLPLVPLWLDEGLAEYYEMPPAERMYGHPHAKNLRWNMLAGGVADIARLEKMSDFEKMSKTDYRDCWAWVHFLLHGSAAGRQELVQYLQNIGEGKDPGLLSSRLAGKIPQPTLTCTSHHRNWNRN